LIATSFPLSAFPVHKHGEQYRLLELLLGFAHYRVWIGTDGSADSDEFRHVESAFPKFEFDTNVCR